MALTPEIDALIEQQADALAKKDYLRPGMAYNDFSVEFAGLLGQAREDEPMPRSPVFRIAAANPQPPAPDPRPESTNPTEKPPNPRPTMSNPSRQSPNPAMK